MSHAAILQGLAASAATLVAARAPANILRAMAPAATAATTTPTYVALATGGLGGFPYYWQNPRSLLFNHLTYDWINSAVDGGASPAMLDDVFTNVFTTALAAVRYILSVPDQQQLDAARAAILTTQLALLNAWQDAFGPSWTGQDTPPIDTVLAMMAATWAGATPITVAQLLTAADPASLLPQAPSQGGAVLIALHAYAAAIRASAPLLDDGSRQNGLLTRALAALKTPDSTKGGMVRDDGLVAPAYRVDTPVAAILAALAREDAGLDAHIHSVANGASNTAATLDGGAVSVGDPARLLSIVTAGGTEVAGPTLATMPVTIAAGFDGVTTVAFGPTPFDPATATGWFWEEPIVTAHRAAPGDGGFVFSPQPPCDFSSRGRFGRLTGLMIARAPRLSLTLDQTAAERLADTVNADPDATLRFLGQTVAAPHTAETVRATVTPGAAGSAATLSIVQTIAAPTLVSRAYVLGGIVRFPDP